MKVLTLIVAPLLAAAGFASTGPRAFDIPGETAGMALAAFARQADVEVMFSTDLMARVVTRPIRGTYEPRAALAAMLDGLPFVVLEDSPSGALAIRQLPGAAPAPASSPRIRRLSPRPSDERVSLPPFQVTGSHVTGLQAASPEPVVTYDAATLNGGGALTADDFLQGLPFNTGTEGSLYNPNGFATAYARGATTLNPRGLGAQRFLVLIDGRRAATYGAPDSTGASVFDFGSLPLEAIESIDYLKDGASAIYGSDAITGVVNIKLRHEYSGAALEAGYGNVVQPGGQGGNPFALTGNLIAGGATGGSSYLLDLRWFRQNGNVIRDYRRSRTTDFSALGPKGDDDSSISAWPFNVNLTAAMAAAAGLTTGAGYYVVAGGAPAAAPNLAQFRFAGASKGDIGDANRFDYAPDSQIVPDQNDRSGLLLLSHDLASGVRLSSRAIWSDNDTRYLYTPDTINSNAVTVSNPTSLATGANPAYLSLPAGNPFNPFGITLGGTGNVAGSFLGRALFGPTRTYDVRSSASSLLVALDGRGGAGWTWSAGLSAASDGVAVRADNNIRSADLQAALDGNLAGYSGEYLNPFGPSPDPALVRSLFVPSYSRARNTAFDGDFSASGPLFSLGREQLTAAAGAEWRDERVNNAPDTANYVVNPTNGTTPFSGSRTISSAFLEIDVPVAGDVASLQLAGRHDQYSHFGGTTNPKLAGAWQALPWLKLRGSYSQSFKAPDPGQLYFTPLTTYSATTTLDPLNPQVPGTAYPQVQGGNPNLRPERGKVWYEGAVIDLGAWAPGLSLSADHFAFSLSQAITTFSNPAQLFTLFPNLVVRGPPSAEAPAGPIAYFNFIPVNAAAFYWRGFDLSLDFAAPPTPIGRFRAALTATRITYFAYDAGSGQGPVNKAGDYNIPRWTAHLDTQWSRGPLAATLSVTWKGPYRNDANAAVWGENALTLVGGTVAWSLAAWHSRVTLGVENLFNTAPPPNGLAIPSDGFDVNTYAAWAVGRFMSLRVRHDF